MTSRPLTAPLAHTDLGPIGLATAAALVVVAVAYGLGASRQTDGPRRRRRSTAFGVALAALAVALLPPLETLAHHRFAGHMAQHLLLTAVAGPALAVAAVPRTIGLAWPGPARADAHRGPVLGRWRRLNRRHLALLPLVAAAGFVAVLGAWHLPGLYDLAVRHDGVHALEHLTLVGASVALWSAVLAAGRAAPGSAVAALFATSIAGGGLGALLTFASSPLYESYRSAGEGTGLTALEDQQLGGVLLWGPGGIVPLAGVVAVLVVVLSPAGRRRRRLDEAAGVRRTTPSRADGPPLEAPESRAATAEAVP